jgi:DNA (cytosine-5)-methyltransferase 1
MSTLDVVAQVLREVAPRALKARQIADLAGSRLPTASKTPETVVSRDLALEVRDRGAASRFLRVDRGAFVLKEALPTALYNENDAYATAWTRNLIAAGELAPGVVNERSIRDLKPADVASYRQFHAFSGIGIWSRALRDAGVPDSFNVWSGSCPCQPWSSAGRRKGHADDRDLWPEWFRLIAACRPALVIGEQVASKDGLTWLDALFNDLEKANYTCQAFDLPACSVGAPHRRQRLYFVAYARDRGREILSAPWLHDRGQPGHDAPRRGEADCRISGAVSDTSSARPRVSQDIGADRGDAGEGAEAIEWRTAGGLEPERGGDVDEAVGVPDAERVVWDEGREPRAHGRTEVELDRHGEAHGTGCGCLGTVGLGDTGLARGGWDTRAVPRTEGVGERERLEVGDLAHEPLAPGADDIGVVDTAGVGCEGYEAQDDQAGNGGTPDGGPGFRPGDRILLDGDPSWGGAVGGFWAADVEWVYCRPEPGHQDGRWRPVESGTQPLVTRSTADLGRTRAARLRGYGNSLVLPVAKVFVEAVIDAFAEAARVQGTQVEAADPAIIAEPSAEQAPPIIAEPTTEEHAA